MVLVDRFQPLKVMGLIQEHKISVLLAIPSMYRVMAATEGDFNVSSVRFPISGGEPLPISIAEAFEKRFRVPIYEGYGQTEAAPVVTLNVPAARKLHSRYWPIRPAPAANIASLTFARSASGTKIAILYCAADGLVLNGTTSFNSSF